MPPAAAAVVAVVVAVVVVVAVIVAETVYSLRRPGAKMPRCNFALTTIAKEFNYALTVKRSVGGSSVMHHVHNRYKTPRK